MCANSSHLLSERVDPSPLSFGLVTADIRAHGSKYIMRSNEGVLLKSVFQTVEMNKFGTDKIERSEFRKIMFQIV